MIDNVSSNDLITYKLQSPLEVSGIEWLSLRNHIPFMAYFIQLTLGAFMRSRSVTGRIKSCETLDHNQQLGEYESIDFGNSQRHRKEGNARINKVSAITAGLATIIE
jgi:hypothetical protein